MEKEIPVTSLQRLPVYLNYLKSLGQTEGNISSGAIARALGMGEVLVRKDLAYTSAQGRTRTGYNRSELIAAIEEYLGCNRILPAVIFGAGALGRALMSYGGFKNYGIDIVAAFDSDREIIGKYVSECKIYHVSEAKEVIQNTGARLAVICVPAAVAQEVCDTLAECGIKAILNFAPVLLKVSEDVNVRNIDVAANLAILSSQI